MSIELPPRHIQLRDLVENTLDSDFWKGLAECHDTRIGEVGHGDYSHRILITDHSGTGAILLRPSYISCLEEEASLLAARSQSTGEQHTRLWT